MMLALILANMLGWPLIQLSLAAIAARLPRSWFTRTTWTTEAARLAGREIALYRKWLAIRSWKGLLPDGANWTGQGFRKGRLTNYAADYFAVYAAETRRGEAAHWAMLACTPVFYLWNPPWACAVMTAYGIAANLPCILVQRYNRAVLMRRLARRGTIHFNQDLTRLSPVE